ERLAWKRDWNAGVLAWKDAMQKSDFEEARAQLKVSGELKTHPMACEMADLNDQNFLSRVEGTERFHWGDIMDKARGAFGRDQYRTAIETIDGLLARSEKGDFTHVAQQEMVG